MSDLWCERSVTVGFGGSGRTPRGRQTQGNADRWGEDDRLITQFSDVVLTALAIAITIALPPY